METKFKIKENYTRQFNMRVPMSLKVKEDRARGMGIDVTDYMRKYYEELLNDILTSSGEDSLTLIPGAPQRGTLFK